jgi:peroxiredoxin
VTENRRNRLAAGTPAPDFTLRSLDGRDRSLSDWRGRRVLLIFVQPDCPSSRRLLPAIAGLLPDPLDKSPAPFIVAFGPEADNRQLVEDIGMRCPVLLQHDVEVSELYLVHATPACCLIDEEGLVVDTDRTGAGGVLAKAGIVPGPGWSVSTTVYRSKWYLYHRLVVPRVWEGLRNPDPEPPSVVEQDALAFPLVSVIMTTRDRPGFLSIALECYRRQTYRWCELIVVDDGTAFPAEESEISALGGRVIRVPRGTPLGAKLNRGVGEARGSLCQKWDDDDWYAPEFLEALVTTYLRHNATVCRPTIAFQIRSLWFDLARWRMVGWHNEDVSGGTLLFARADWKESPFRELQNGEDLWFLIDQVMVGASLAPIHAEHYIYVRHDSLGNDRTHSWTRWTNGRQVDAILERRRAEFRHPAEIFPDWALSAYANLLRKRGTGQLQSRRARR